MKWLKYLIQFMVCASDFLLLGATVILFFGISYSLISFIFVLILYNGLYKTWKKTGGLSHWKKETRQQFYKNWDSICEGKNK